jgi:hypothetical protein
MQPDDFQASFAGFRPMPRIDVRDIREPDIATLLPVARAFAADGVGALPWYFDPVLGEAVSGERVAEVPEAVPGIFGEALPRCGLPIGLMAITGRKFDALTISRPHGGKYPAGQVFDMYGLVEAVEGWIILLPVGALSDEPFILDNGVSYSTAEAPCPLPPGPGARWRFVASWDGPPVRRVMRGSADDPFTEAVSV